MKIFIDSAHVADIREAAALGYVAGVTTNPSLMAKEEGEPAEILKQICGLLDGPVSAEVISVNAQGMIQEAREYARIAPNIVVKIPMTKEGLKAVAVLEREGIKTNVTLVFSANQALLAARAGASYVSPFIGRIDDMGQEGIKVVKEIAIIFELHNIPCQIIAASIRHPAHVTAAAMAGADIATIPFKVLDLMLTHPLTDSGLTKFLTDWEKKKAAQ